MVEVADGGEQRCVAELSADDGEVDALGPQFRRVRVPQPVCVDTLVDPGRAGEFRQTRTLAFTITLTGADRNLWRVMTS